MTLARSWLGSVVRVSGLTLLVPFGLLMAVAVAATVGGAGTGVGQLGQLFAGPGIPPATIGVPMPAERTGGLAPFSNLVPAVPVTASPQLHVPVVPQGQGTTTRRPAGVGHRTRPVPRGREVVPSPNPSPARPSPPPPAAPPPAPPSTPSLIRQVGNELKRIVEPLPKPVGPIAADAVDTVIDLLDPSGSPKPLQPLAGAVGSLLHRP